MDPNEPNWRTNSSFSPTLSRRWDCRFHSDGYGAPPCESSTISSSSKGSRSRVRSERFPNHHYSVSDGALSYFGSPSNSVQAPRWTPPVQKFNIPEFATPSIRESMLETSLFPESTERRFTARVSGASNSFRSPSPISESSPWESSSKRPISFPQRNFSGRRSFMSKPVYPLLFRNPVSDTEGGLADMASGSRLTPGENRTSPLWSQSTSSLDVKFHRTLTELQKMEASPDPSTSSRREGFRWSNASSYDIGFDGESIDMSGPVDLESLRPPYSSINNQKCGYCGRLLWQKSPWSSYRIVKSGDMPVAGVLSCSHVFHAECLEQTTPKTQIHDPPCPLCLKIAVEAEATSAAPEPIQMTLGSVCGNQGVNIADDGTGNNGDQPSDQTECGLRRNLSISMSRRGGNSMIKNQIKKHFSFKGKAGKDIFGASVFRRSGSSSSDPHATKNSIGCSRTMGRLSK
ncbi:hypothetical protein AAC387_Pa03g0763 [Persea americana]|eukprot:TRINITY_DN5384_c0_g2_i1.p1 TRINITY_DN5384_c0_g2~~TRINITY_DN5384_c0_g2_i1.p1  ORF type:complete len:460 (+),score=77.12 TRINITY_DN5384_c0_g2_i1:782-2161(+)